MLDVERPAPSRDLDDPEEIAEMVRRFYADVAQDALLGPLFNNVAHTDWSAHLPKLTAFWCRALFSMPGYEGNPYRSHQDVHAQSPFTVAHFERWLELFVDIVDSGCCGMAGSFGYQHYEISMQIGERVLLPAVRAADGAAIVAPGFSCRRARSFVSMG